MYYLSKYWFDLPHLTSLLTRREGLLLCISLSARQTSLVSKPWLFLLWKTLGRLLIQSFTWSFSFLSLELHPPPLPSHTGQGEAKFVTYRGFTAKLKSLLPKAGLSPEKFSGHSLRRGGATFLYACGASILQIQACCDWASSVWTRYIYISLEQRMESQRLMASKISSEWVSSTSSSPPLPALNSLPFPCGFGMQQFWFWDVTVVAKRCVV